MANSFRSENKESCIVIYLHHLDAGSSDYEHYYSLLDDDEKQRTERYRFDIHRQRFAISRGRLREILAEFGHCDPVDINFKKTRFGKPFIAKPEGLNRLYFNASKSGSIGGVAISRTGPVGLDIEQHQSANNRDIDMIVQHEFTTDELNWYLRHPAGIERERAFYRLWTCKEAYLKALGLGLGGGLNEFSIDLQGSRPSVTYTELEEGRKTGLLMSQSVTDDAAICVAYSIMNAIRIVNPEKQ